MTYDDYMQTVLASKQEDWESVEDVNVFFYKQDVNVWIKKETTSEAFNEPWTTQFADKMAYRVFCNIHYGATVIKRIMLVDVDGGRAVLPIPTTRDSKVVKAMDYKIAKIIDDGQLDVYMSRAGFKSE